MKKTMLLIFLGLVLAVSGLRAVDDDETFWDAKVEQVLKTLRENGTSERIVEKVFQDMTDSHNRNALKGPDVTVEPLIATGSEGASNTLYGNQAGAAITSGTANCFFGAAAGEKTTIGYRNNFIGFGAGYFNTTGKWNMFLGYGAGNKNVHGNYNTFVGETAGFNNTEGDKNTFIGAKAGFSGATGYYNTFIGNDAGYSSNGFYNTFIGDSAGYSDTIGNYNTFIGEAAGYSNTTGHYNTYFGRGAGFYSVDGIFNTMIGCDSGTNNTNGISNTFIGAYAGHFSSGNNNTFIGECAGQHNTGSGNVFLGYLAGNLAISGSNKLVIDNGDNSNPLIYGDFSARYVGINNAAPGYTLVVGAGGAYCNGTTWVDGSSREYKENIVELTSAEALRAFAQLEPVKFNYKQDKEDPCLGFIAEDVPELVATKDRKGLSPMDMVAMLTKVVQEQQKTLQEQQKTLTELQEKITKLERKP